MSAFGKTNMDASTNRQAGLTTLVPSAMSRSVGNIERQNVNAKSHVCTICHNVYSTKGNLTRHSKQHTECPSFACPVEGCKYSPNGGVGWFHRKDHVVAHLQSIHRFDLETAKFIMGSRGAINPLTQQQYTEGFDISGQQNNIMSNNRYDLKGGTVGISDYTETLNFCAGGDSGMFQPK